jgi:ribosomal protein L33
MSDNPLKQYFKQPAAYVKLPSQGKWYKPEDVTMNAEGEVAVYPMGAIDDILMNTPDAMLNGQALEKVIQNCVPEVKNVKRLLIPDFDAILVGIKSASHNGKIELKKSCPKCSYDNELELNANLLLDTVSTISADMTVLDLGDLLVYIKPYDFEMRQIWIRKEFEEERAISALEKQNATLDELQKANLLAESVQKIAQMTFGLVARSIEKIVLKSSNTVVSNQEHIAEWLVSIDSGKSEAIIDSVNKLNEIGVMKQINLSCHKCTHQWNEKLNFDPTSFFGKRSSQVMQP